MLGLILLSAVTMNLLISLSQSMMESSDGVSVAITGDDSGLSGLYMLATALSNSNFSIVFAIFASLFVCSDYTNGTLKNVIARGYGRISIYASKYIVSLIAATIYAIFCWIVGFLSGTAFWGAGSLMENDTAWSFISILLLQLLAVYAYTSMFFLISALLKKTGGAIAVGIVAPLIIVMIISLLDALIHSESFSISNYWLDNCLVNISAISVSSDVMVRSLICFLIYAVIFTLGGHLIGSKNEV